MSEFGELLASIMCACGVQGIQELVTLINALPKREDDPPMEEEEIEAAARGLTNPHPAFFRWLKEALELTDDQAMRLVWAFFMGEKDYPGGLELPPALPGP